ncbi:uncharacterized protein FOMMEDRAFT_18630 [Fomitiporia mediterranea MF3/22]|uniref:uncharacterized protein n=1 Tax=Fomitiporia mediterranea (strain MF3/22) TaxID=694068 RepID=UPI000440727A|nr:uncharacterized protein FOMMEDRAFT_18630 [Fomitiporia mediterranea MF3/22]EJD04930.1 hypothetical protein FOMMEDRAFT_18630 [Fomitiporia mediterranea MF3/22]
MHTARWLCRQVSHLLSFCLSFPSEEHMMYRYSTISGPSRRIRLGALQGAISGLDFEFRWNRHMHRGQERYGTRLFTDAETRTSQAALGQLRASELISLPILDPQLPNYSIHRIIQEFNYRVELECSLHDMSL